jgi:phage-related protein
MEWILSYFEQENAIQPAEVFEDELYQANPKFLGKLLYIHERLKEYGHQLGGYVEKCHDYQGLWEIRIIHSNRLVREFWGFDGEHIVLLHGYVKSVGKPASKRDLDMAYNYWTEYLRTRLVSPIQEDDNEST